MAAGHDPRLGSILTRAGLTAWRQWPLLLGSMLVLDFGLRLVSGRLADVLAVFFYGNGLMLLTIGLQALLTIGAVALGSGIAAALLLAEQAGEASPRAAALAAVRRSWPRLLLAALVLTLPTLLRQILPLAITLDPEFGQSVVLLSAFTGLATLLLSVLLAPLYGLAVDTRAHGRRFFGLAFGLARSHPWMLLGLYILVMLPVPALTSGVTWLQRQGGLSMGYTEILGFHPLALAFGILSGLARQFLVLVDTAFYWERLEGGRRTVSTADVFD